MSALEEITILKERLAAKGLFPGTSGNLGIRNGETLFVTTSGVDKYITNENSFVAVDVLGQPLKTSSLKPSLETCLHVKVFNQTQANVSIHIHTVNNNLISELYGDEGKVVFQNQELIKAFGFWQEDDQLVVPIIENPSDVEYLAELFAEHVHQDYGVVLIRNHGVNVWGKTKEEALKLFEAFEFLCEYTLKIKQLKK